ncbi:MAG: NAD(P)-dependent oxidoreductase [Gammaproteobacteria bacterium]|uniref:NAD(P)-dependent oxidoreductase n=1 Tax=SAR86 cluster bacterium TaxID=2030880 RepID=A0A838YID3_9GAMM|nr:NAD(P)-dependent oxidoreductase [SAR86 cluster bacterium]
MDKVGFIGLGVMGYPMSSHISKSGFQTHIFNRTSKISNNWNNSCHGSICASPKEVAKHVDFLCLCVSKDEDVKEVLCGKDGVIEAIKPGTIIIDHTTTSASLAREMHKIFEKINCHYLDAPVSGGQAGAENGSLTIMVGGNEEAYKRSKKVLSTYSKFSKYMGKTGNGQLTKMVNQIAIASLIQGLAESVNFSEESGLEPKDVLQVISKGAAQSWQMDNRWETMTKDEFDFGFAVDLMRKDLDIVESEAAKLDVNIETTKLINNFYRELQEMGGGDWDTSSLVKRIRKKT